MRCKNTDSAEGLHGELKSDIVPDFAKFFTDVTGIKLPVPKEEKKKDRGNGGFRPPMGGFYPRAGFKTPEGMNPPNFGPGAGKDKDKDKEDEEEKDSTGIKLDQSGNAVTFRMVLALN